MANKSDKPVAVITGASRGIGAACAHHLASRGLNVLIGYATREQEARATASQCESEGVEAHVSRCDVSIDVECRRLVDHALDHWKRVDVLVNNAGTTTFADQNDLEALDKSDFDRIFSVNVAGAWQMARAASEALKVSPIGSVVNVSSHSGMSGIGSSSAYAASKGALNTLTLSLARSLAPDVRVNAVCPGFVDTQWMEPKLDPDRLETFKKLTAKISPLNKLVSAGDVSEAVGWFALGGHAITGQLLVVDGGTHLTTAHPL